jgi:nitroreductase
MDFLELARSRFSCRVFAPTPLTRPQIESLLEAARWAPNGGNLQPWRFVVVQSPTLRRGLAAAAYSQRFIGDAPAVIVACALPEVSGLHYGERGRTLYCLQDTAAAVQTILLAATALGLGACWVGAFDEDAVSSLLTLPAGWRPVTLVPVGTPRERAPRRHRQPVEEITVWLSS